MIRITPEAERPRERCLNKGAESLSLRECLALVVGSGPKGVGCLGVASEILARPGSGLSGADEERALFHAIELRASGVLDGVSGMGDASRARVLAVFELARRYAVYREQIKRPRYYTPLAPELAKRALDKVPVSLRNEPREWLGFVPYYANGDMGGLCVVEKGVRTHVNIDLRNSSPACLRSGPKPSTSPTIIPPAIPPPLQPTTTSHGGYQPRPPAWNSPFRSLDCRS